MAFGVIRLPHIKLSLICVLHNEQSFAFIWQIFIAAFFFYRGNLAKYVILYTLLGFIGYIVTLRSLSIDDFP